MRPSQILGASALAAVCAASAAAQTAASTPSIHDFLPSSTMAVFSIPDMGASMERFKSMPLAKMWHEDEVQDFFADLLELGEAQWNRMIEQGHKMHANGDLPVSPDDLLKLRLNGSTVALTHFGMTTSEWGDPIPDVGIVVQLDFGDSADSWFKLIDMGIGMMQQEAGDNMVRADVEIGSYKLTSMTPTRNEVPMSLNMARVGNSLVFGTDTEEVTSIISGLSSQKRVLGSAGSYQSAVAQLGIGKPEMTGFMQMKPFVDAIVDGVRVIAEAEGAPIDPDGIGRALDAMGFNSIQSSAFASSYENGECVSRSYTVSPQPTRRGFFAGGVKNLEMDFLRWVPKGAVSVSAATMDVGSIYDALAGGLRAYDEELHDQMMAELAKHEDEYGMTIKEDLFGAFGDQYISWSMPMVAMGSPPEMAFLIKVRDQQRLMKTLNTLTELSDGLVELNDVNRRGIEAHQLRVNMPAEANMMMNPFDMFVPTFSFKDGYMVVGFSAGDVKRVFDRMDREDDPSGDIRGNEEVAALIQRLPESGVTSVSFTDWKANFEALYQVATGVLAFLPMDQDMPVDFVLLPESTTLTQHLTGGVSYTVADGNGFSTVSHSPFGPEVIVGLGVLAGGAAAFMGMREIR